MAQLGVSGIYYIQYIYTYIQTHIIQQKNYAPKLTEKDILNSFLHKITRGYALAVQAAIIIKLATRLSFFWDFVHRIILRMPHSQQYFAHSTGYFVPHSWQNFGKCPDEFPSMPLMFPPLSEDP